MASFEAGFRNELERLGYVEPVVELQLRLMDDVSRWLECAGGEVGGFDVEAIAAFLAERGRVRRSRPVKKSRRDARVPSQPRCGAVSTPAGSRPGRRHVGGVQALLGA